MIKLKIKSLLKTKNMLKKLAVKLFNGFLIIKMLLLKKLNQKEKF